MRVVREQTSYPMFRRDGHFAVLVTGEMAGKYEAPIYGMLAVEDALKAQGASDIQGAYEGQLKDEGKTTLLWDSEWEVTYVTFRDMGWPLIFALVGFLYWWWVSLAVLTCL